MIYIATLECTNQSISVSLFINMFYYLFRADLDETVSVCLFIHAKYVFYDDEKWGKMVIEFDGNQLCLLRLNCPLVNFKMS